jgi:predicted DsbA family dithiol-disulfide isomerase
MNKLTNIAIVFAALAVGSAALYDSFFRPPARSAAGNPNAPPEFVENWKALEAISHRDGNPTAPVQIVEFVDFECPFCARYDPVLRQVMQEYPDVIALNTIHYPLPPHPHARAAAAAFECADAQGAGKAMGQTLYARQAEFGRNPWSEFAAASGVADTAIFADCLTRQPPHPRIESGVQAARQLEIGGTPTLIINGYLFASPPPDSSLRAIVQAVLKGDQIPGAKSTKATRSVVMQ